MAAEPGPAGGVEAAALVVLVVLIAMVGTMSFIAGALAVCGAIRRRYPAAYRIIREYQVHEQQAGRKLYPEL